MYIIVKQAVIKNTSYPKEISSIIITENPINVKRAIRSFFSFDWLSGINSSTTTYIMAPAANASI